MSKPGKESEAAKKLAADEEANRQRFEKAITELREGAYRFAQRAREQASIVVDELIDPEGECVATIAEVEGDAGALALSMPLDLIQFDTWLFGQIGDKEELDLKDESHWAIWFDFGAWLGETLRRRHGGHWLLMGEDSKTWRVGFSKVMLEIAPFLFAEQLMRMGSGALRKMVTEIERIRAQHNEQKERDKGKDVDRFLAQHYVRMHTVPLGQWMALDFTKIIHLWGTAPVKELIAAVRENQPRMPPQNQGVVEQVITALGKANQDKPVSEQTKDRGLFEAVAQITSLRKVTAPIAIDILERVVVPALHVGIPDKFPPLDDDDLASLRKGVELFVFFIEVVPHKFQADDAGFLGSIPHEDLSTPYSDRNVLEIGKGDWVVVNPKHFIPALTEFDPKRLLEKYDEFVKYVAANPDAPRRRDDGRYLAEVVARSLTDLKMLIGQCAQEKLALVFRLLPPAG